MTETTEGAAIVVGASAAGLSAADGLREGGYEGAILVLGDEHHQPYDRPTLSKKLLASQGAPELHPLRTPERLASAGIELVLGRRAVGLDIDRHFVVTDHGDAIAWDAVVIATGSRPRSLTTSESEQLPVLRTPEDLNTLRRAAARYGEITLIGAGLIGSEIAANISGHQVAVTLINDLELPLRRQVGEPVAEAIRDLHRAHGVDLKLGVTVTGITGSTGSYAIHLSDGSVHRTGFVVAGIGVDANDEWLLGSGVALDAGVLVDAAGRTNVPGVWATGDVARMDHPLLPGLTRVEHWTNAVEHGRHVGLNLARGTAAPYAGAPYFWTEQYGRRFHNYGRVRPEDDAVVAEGTTDADEYLVLYGSGDEFHAVVSCGCVTSLRGYRKILERGGSWADALALAATKNPGVPA
jgi:NADPH-dependent 2,4-dienoyl-CoA reductase/sulfur reductase-like enzyme